MHELYTDEVLSVSYDVSHDWLYVDWAADQTEDSVRFGCAVLLDLVKQHRVRHVLNDNRKVRTVWSGVAEWGGTVWFPAMADAGVEYFAWIYSPHLYSRLSTDLTLEHVTRPVVLTFDEYDTARRWLRAM